MRDGVDNRKYIDFRFWDRGHGLNTAGRNLVFLIGDGGRLIGWRERHSIACFGEHWLPEGLKPGGVDRLEKYEEPENIFALPLTVRALWPSCTVCEAQPHMVTFLLSARIALATSWVAWIRIS